MHWAKLPKGSSWLCQSQIDNAGGFQPLLFSPHVTCSLFIRYCTIFLLFLSGSIC